MLVMSQKIRFRICDICNLRKQISEFSKGRICLQCDEGSTIIGSDAHPEPENVSDLYIKIGQIDEKLDRMERLMLGLMDMLGKINNDMELSKVDVD